MTQLSRLEDEIAEQAQAFDGEPDGSWQIANWLIDRLRDGPYRLDPDPAPGPEIAYHFRLVTGDGQRLGSVITCQELQGLDAAQRMRTILTAAGAAAQTLEIRQGFHANDRALDERRRIEHEPLGEPQDGLS